MGDDLLSPGAKSDSVFNLLDGWAFLYSILEDGRRQIVHFALPGAVLAFQPGGRMAATFGIQALTDVVASVIPHQTLTSMSQADPLLGTRLIASMSRDLSLAFDHLTNVGRQSARERVAHLLLELFIRYRLQWPGTRSEEMFLPLTQEHVGDATGLTPIHVNRVLRDLRQDGIVEFRYRRLRILNPDKLIDVAGIDYSLATSWIRNGCVCEHCETHGSRADRNF